MKKKIIKLLLITTLSTLILTGCKDSEETISNVDETTETTSVIESNEVAENISDATSETTSTSETSKTESDSASAIETSESETTSEIETSEMESNSTTETTTETVSTTTESTEENTSEENSSESGIDASTTNSEAIVSTDFIVLLNAKRAEAGLSPVSMDANLDATALAGARELQTNMSHQVAGGGYDRCNIGYMSSVSVQGMFDGWWNSEGHRAQMMDPYLTHAAAAYCNGYIIFIGNIDEEAYLNSLDTPSTTPVTDPVNSTDVGNGQTVEVEGTPGAVEVVDPSTLPQDIQDLINSTRQQ